MCNVTILRLLSVGLVAGLLVGVPGGSASAADADGGDPVLGHGLASSGVGAKGNTSVVTLHGVRRIPGATVVYVSGVLKYPERGLGHYFLGSSTGEVRLAALGLCQTTIVDTRGGKVLDPLPSPSFAQTGCFVVPDAMPSAGRGEDKGLLAAVVLPALPDETSTIDLMVGGVAFQDVEVADGYLEPMAEGTARVPLDAGRWPRIEQADVDKVKECADCTRSLEFAVEDASGETSCTLGGKVSTVRVKSDILFAVDQYRLTDAAKVRLKAVAEDLKATADLSRPVKVVGHTDDVNTHSYNQTLSENRAKSVADELKELLPAGTRFEVSGKSFDEPIADNSSDEGRARNRRVDIEVTNK